MKEELKSIEWEKEIKKSQEALQAQNNDISRNINLIVGCLVGKIKDLEKEIEWMKKGEF